MSEEQQDTENAAARENAENAEKTTHETTDSNAGDDAVQGTVAEAEPTDIGDQKPMNEGL